MNHLRYPYPISSPNSPSTAVTIRSTQHTFKVAKTLKQCHEIAYNLIKNNNTQTLHSDTIREIKGNTKETYQKRKTNCNHDYDQEIHGTHTHKSTTETHIYLGARNSIKTHSSLSITGISFKSFILEKTIVGVLTVGLGLVRSTNILGHAQEALVCDIDIKGLDLSQRKFHTLQGTYLCSECQEDIDREVSIPEPPAEPDYDEIDETTLPPPSTPSGAPPLPPRNYETVASAYEVPQSTEPTYLTPGVRIEEHSGYINFIP